MVLVQRTYKVYNESAYGLCTELEGQTNSHFLVAHLILLALTSLTDP